VAIYPRVFFQNDSLSRLRCSKGGFDLWLGDNSDIVYGKMSTSIHILTGYGPTSPSFSLTTGRENSHKDIKLVEELLLGFIAGAVTKALSLGLLVGAVAKTLTLSLRHLK
jgi:hypothetical protein